MSNNNGAPKIVIESESRPGQRGKARKAKPAAAPQVVIAAKRAPRAPSQKLVRGLGVKGAELALAQAATHRGRLVANAGKKAGGKFDKVGASLAAALLNPLGAEPQRNPKFCLRPTAVAKLHIPDELVFGNGGADFLNRKDAFVAVFRDPRRFAVMYAGTCAANIYEWVFADANGLMTVDITNPLGADQPFNPVGARWFSGEKIHDDILYAGITEEATTGVWVDSGASIQIVGLTALTSYTFRMIRTLNGATTYTDVTASTDGSGHWTYLVPDGSHGYYNVSHVALVGTYQVYTIYPGNTSCFRHRAIPDFSKRAVDAESMHISAADILLTNTSDDQYTNGMAYGVQVSGDKEWTAYIPATAPGTAGSSIGPTFAKMVEAQSMTAKKGIHGPLLPTDSTDFNAVDLGGVDSTESAIEPFPFSSTNDYIIAYLNVGDSSYNGQNFHVTITCHVEFQTQSQWYELRMCPYTPEMMDKVIFAMRGSPVWTANENHISKIFGWIKNKFLPVASSAAVMAAPAFGAYAPLIRTAGMIGGGLARL